MTVTDELLARVRPADGVTLSPLHLACAVVVAGVLVAVGPLWSTVRLVVTLAHELGHALVGVLVGRRFSGFVVRGDMSGHAVTSGRPRGPGIVATTWAGYPAPALLATGLVASATRGWSAPVLTGVLLVLLWALIRVRSLLTAVVMATALGASASLWWWRAGAWQGSVLIGLAAVLLVGGWRQLGAVAASRGPQSDPARLADLTHVPRLLWVLSFGLVLAAATAACIWLLLPAIHI